MVVPNGAEMARPFLPAKNFAASKNFYEALGFEKLLDADVAIFGIGRSAFILTNFYQEGYAENCMMQLMVDDLDAWWDHIVKLDLPARFEVRVLKSPALQPWGLRAAYLSDPSGVLWHIAERRRNAPAD
jgi:hypothetical protein